MGVRFGQPIPIVLQLVDGNVSRYPQVWLKERDGTAISGPHNLTHVANGLYVYDGSLLMPNFPEVVAQFITYTDAGHTTLDPINGLTEQGFELGAPVGSVGEIEAVVDTEGQVYAKVDCEECSCH